MRTLLTATLLLTSAMALPLALPLVAHANTAGGPPLPQQAWSFNGLRASWDKDQLYRGYTVATQVCTACHGLQYISPRDMMRAGFTEAEVKAMAKALDMDMNAKFKGGMDEATAKETFGKVPPDLSLMTRARAGGADYVYGVLMGYAQDPAVVAEYLPEGIPEGANFNLHFPGHAIAMPNPLTGPDLVTYHDGTPASVEQMTKDVTTFLQWAAEPERFERHHLGVYVLLYILFFALLAYATKRVIWKDVKGH